ncbi:MULTISPECIES: hypothetical protein [unclassified Tychonema]|nr:MULTISPECIES: hypothetical protein [unclassified Tychonema]MBE9131790.1 hypothetical protein [Tychonema sp. LEGE 07196]
MEDGRWKMEDGRWKMEDGRWKMEDGKKEGFSYVAREAIHCNEFSN